MSDRHPIIDGMTRLGAIGALLVFLFVGLGPSLRYGHSIGDIFAHGVAGTALEGGFVGGLMIVLGTLLGALAGLMLFILFGALVGTAIGTVLARSLPTLRAAAGSTDGSGSAAADPDSAAEEADRER